MADIRTYNVVILGIAFLLVFTAFTTCGNIEVSKIFVPGLFSKTYVGFLWDGAEVVCQFISREVLHENEWVCENE